MLSPCVSIGKASSEATPLGICTLGLLPFLFKTLREILFLAWAGHVMEIVVAKEVVALEDRGHDS